MSRNWEPDRSNELLAAAFDLDYQKIVEMMKQDDHPDINSRDSGGRTCLHYALGKEDRDCKSAVEKAKMNSHRKMTVQLLLKRGADVELENNDGMTPAAIAKEKGYRLLAMLMNPTQSTKNLLQARLQELQSSSGRRR